MAKPNNRRRAVVLAIAASATLLVVALPAFGRLWVDLSWFEELG